jgi:hypothetical protein
MANYQIDCVAESGSAYKVALMYFTGLDSEPVPAAYFDGTKREAPVREVRVEPVTGAQRGS